MRKPIQHTRRITGESIEVDRHVGNRLKLRRCLLGISQQALAKTIGVTFQQVQKYESGHNRIGASRLYDITKALSCEANYFFEELPSATDLGADADPTKSSRAIELVFHFQRIGLRDEKLGTQLFDLMRHLSGESVHTLTASQGAG